MAKGVFIFIRNNEPFEIVPTRRDAHEYELPRLEDVLYGHDLVQRADRVIFQRNNGQLWILKDRHGSTVPVPSCVVSVEAPSAYGPGYGQVLRAEDELKMARAHCENGYRIYPVPMAINDVKVALVEAEQQKNRADRLQSKLDEAEKRLANEKSCTESQAAMIRETRSQLFEAQKKNTATEERLTSAKWQTSDVTKTYEAALNKIRNIESAYSTLRDELAANREAQKKLHMRPIRPPFVEKVRKLLATEYETYSRGFIVGDVRELLKVVDESTVPAPVDGRFAPGGLIVPDININDIREHRYSAADLVFSINGKQILPMRMPFFSYDPPRAGKSETISKVFEGFSDYLRSLPPAAEPKFPPRAGDVWRDKPDRGSETWTHNGKLQPDGGFEMVCDAHQAIHYARKYEFDKYLDFVSRGKPKLGVKVDGNTIVLDRTGDTRTQYNPFALMKLVGDVIDATFHKPVTPELVRVAQNIVDRWLVDQISRGALFYCKATDRWTTRP